MVLNIRFIIRVLTLGLLWLTINTIAYSQEDHVEVKGNAKANVLDFDNTAGDNILPQSPLEGEVYYDFGANQPKYRNNSSWQVFGSGSASGDKYVATKIVAASDSQGTTGCPGACTNPRADYVCDGTDDQEQINQAINNLPTPAGNSIGAVYLLEGTYNISTVLKAGETQAGINPHPNTAIIGSGSNTILKVIEGTNTINVINVVNYANILISQLKIDGYSSLGVNNYGVYFNAVTNSTIDKVWVVGLSSAGIYLRASSNNTVSGSNVQEGWSDGIILMNSSNNNIFSGNIVKANGYYGIFSNGSSNNIFYANNIQGNVDSGIYLYSASNNNTLYANNIQANGTDGIHLEGSSNNTLYANNVQTNGNHGIFIVEGSSNNTLSANNVQINYLEGIYLYRFSSNNIVSSNIIYNNGPATSYDGIKIEYDSNANLLSSNMLYDSSGTSRPINIASSDCDNTYIVNNLVSAWPAGYERISDVGTGTIYTDKQKMTLEKKIISTSNPTYVLDVAVNPRTYVFFSTTTNIDLKLNNGKTAGDLLIIENGTSGKSIQVREVNNANVNLKLATTILNQNNTLELIWNGSKWIELDSSLSP